MFTFIWVMILSLVSSFFLIFLHPPRCIFCRFTQKHTASHLYLLAQQSCPYRLQPSQSTHHSITFLFFYNSLQICKLSQPFITHKSNAIFTTSHTSEHHTCNYTYNKPSYLPFIPWSSSLTWHVHHASRLSKHHSSISTTHLLLPNTITLAWDLIFITFLNRTKCNPTITFTVFQTSPTSAKHNKKNISSSRRDREKA